MAEWISPRAMEALRKEQVYNQFEQQMAMADSGELSRSQAINYMKFVASLEFEVEPSNSALLEMESVS